MKLGDTQKGAPETPYYDTRANIRNNVWLAARQLFLIQDENRLGFTPGVLGDSAEDMRSLHLPMNVTRISGAYNALETDDVLIANFTGSTPIYLLSTTGTYNPIYVKLISSGTSAVITPVGSEKIDGASTYTLSTQYSSVVLMPCIFEWNILSKY